MSLNSYADIPDETSPDAIKYGVEECRKAFHNGALLSIDTREDLLRKFYYAIVDNKKFLADAIHLDLNKSYEESEMSEIGPALGSIGWLTENVRRLSKDTPIWDVPFGVLLMFPSVKKCPIGVVAIISPWNYPMLPLSAIAAAIAAGNTVVFKPSELSPHSSKAIDKLLQSVFDKSLVTTVQGGVPQSTELLAQHFDKIMYTGSTVVGKIVAKAAVPHLTPLLLELGGKSPVFVTGNADVDVAAKRVAWGKWLNAGQTCVAPDYVLADPKVLESFATKIGEAVKTFYPNLNGKSQGYGHIINQRHFDRLSKALEATKGKVLQYGTPDRDALFFPPTIVTGVTPSDSLMQEELFGPILPIIKSDSIQEGVKIVTSQYDNPLALYIFTNNRQEEDYIVQHTRSGGVCTNDTLLHVSIDGLPFGGIGDSGMGNYHGEFGFRAFTHERASIRTPTFLEPLMNIRYHPLDSSKIARMQRLNSFHPSFGREGPVARSPLAEILRSILFGLLILVMSGVRFLLQLLGY